MGRSPTIIKAAAYLARQDLKHDVGVAMNPYPFTRMVVSFSLKLGSSPITIVMGHTFLVRRRNVSRAFASGRSLGLVHDGRTYIPASLSTD